MTERATLETLLARVLKGAGPDRELDFAIAAAFGWPDSPNLHQHARRYTESLDAALTLVPEGWLYELHSGNDEDWAEVKLFPNRVGARFWTRAATPARALIAACLKARMGAQPSSNT